MNTSPLLSMTPAGLYCAAGDFYVDPWQPVPRAVITHAHGDHARRGMGQYVCAADGASLLGIRVGMDSEIHGVEYGENVDLNGVRVSLHPAGHILGSSQVRIEHRGEVWVASGDYKVAPDRTCRPFEPVPCHTFITESTFGLPIYRWPEEKLVFDDINQWWRENQANGRASVLLAYALGKSQRLLSGIDRTIGPIFTHGAVETLTEAYREAGIDLPETRLLTQERDPETLARSLVIGPPSVQGTTWLRRLGQFSTAFASGWMTVRGARRRRSVDRGFVLSDHADWPELINTIRATEAERILVTHGSVATLVRWLRGQGWSADGLSTRYGDEVLEAEEATALAE